MKISQIWAIEMKLFNSALGLGTIAITFRLTGAHYVYAGVFF